MYLGMETVSTVTRAQRRALSVNSRVSRLYLTLFAPLMDIRSFL
jgi:hypothetical protein